MTVFLGFFFCLLLSAFLIDLESLTPKMGTLHHWLRSSASLQSGGPRGLQALLEDRIRNYQEAAASAKEAGEAAKARRCERGLKVRWARLGTSAGRSEAEGSEG